MTTEATFIPIQENGKRFKSLTETYKINTFLLTMGLMYPNPLYDNKRTKWIVVVILTCLPGITLICNDMRMRLLKNDMANLVRQSIVMVSLLFVVVKLILSVLRKKEIKAIFDSINEDYEKYNDLPEEYRDIVDETIKKTKKLEKIWTNVMFVTASSYPVLAGVCTIYSQLFSESPRRYMVHEMAVVLITEEQKYQSPFFEVVTLYTIYVVWIIFIGFTGYDGMFSVCILHVSLKIKIFNQNLKHIFDDVEDLTKIKRSIAKFVQDHCEVNRLIVKIQRCYEIWLVGIFFNAVLQIGMALIQITSSSESDINGMYYLFVIATIVHIYLPCYLASDVTYNAAEVANVVYTSSWENVQDAGVRKSIVLIIAKAQIPTYFKAFNMLTFNMEMFVSILQTSYSMYTLLRS